MESSEETELLPPWQEQITNRCLVVSAILGSVFCMVTHKLSLTVGLIPSLNIAAGLLGFVIVRSWVVVLTNLGFSSKPFTRQENTVIQTCVVACYGMAASGGYGSNLLAMSSRVYRTTGPDYPGNNAQDVKDPELGWMISFALASGFAGVLAVVPLRKIMVIDYKLTFPSGTATARVINGFHTNSGYETARRQVWCLGKFFVGSFLWSCFKWFFSGVGVGCGFENFPSLGLKAYANSFYFDFNATFVGIGMMCPPIISVSFMLGAILSWGIMWPMIRARAGDWYPASPGHNSLAGLSGYQIFMAMSLILGDGLYKLLKIMAMILRYMCNTKSPSSECVDHGGGIHFDIRERVFMKDNISSWMAGAGFLAFSVLSMLVIPWILPPVKWYYVLICYLVTPAFAFCNAYGAGLSDFSLSSDYARLALFLFSAWGGAQGGGVIAGLGTCTIVGVMVATAADLLQDFKTGCLTLSSARAMFIAQLLGNLMGCILAPLTFWMFWTASGVGLPGSGYEAPFATMARQLAIVVASGDVLSALPKYCVELSMGCFCFAGLLNLMRDLGPKKLARWLPVAFGIAIPFYIGANVAIDMLVGCLIVVLWKRVDRNAAQLYTIPVTSGLLCGDGVWAVPAAILAMLRLDPPICMTFLPSSV